MLCWICPECGRDCSPAVRECPACSQPEARISNGVLSLVESLRAVPPIRLLNSGPPQYLLFGLTNGHSVTLMEPAVLTEPGPVAPAGYTIDSLVRSLVESAKPVAPVPRYTELPAPVNPPSSQPSAAAPPLAAHPTAFLAPVLHIAELTLPIHSPAKTAPSVESPALPAAEPTAITRAPIPKPASLPVSKVRFVELAAPPSIPSKTAALVAPTRLAAKAPARIASTLPDPTPFLARALQITELTISSARSVKTVGSIQTASPFVASTPALPAQPRTRSAAFPALTARFPQFLPVAETFCVAAALTARIGAISRALEVQSQMLLDAIKLRLEADESEIHAIIFGFRARPAFALLAAPDLVVEAPAAPDFEWFKTPRPAISGRKPPDLKYHSITAAAQNIPLAGPSLPAQLRNFIEAPPAERVRFKKRISLPAWIASFVVATGLFLAAGSLLQYLVVNREARAATVVPAGRTAAAVPAVPIFEQHPLARFVEVTGLRVVADLNHRSQVQYIVVNHSATQLSSMLIKIAVRSSAEPAGAAPLFTVSAVIPSLGPHQSKEIRTDLDSELRSTAIPDWEFLRTDVHVGTQN